MGDELKKKNITSKKITRKEAIKKVSKYTALTAAAMLILDPPNASAQGSVGDAPAAPSAW